jgi:hypothetical protein
LVQSWCSFGEVLVQFWCSSGAVLVQFWCSSGAVLVQFWCSSGAVLVQFQGSVDTSRTHCTQVPEYTQVPKYKNSITASHTTDNKPWKFVNENSNHQAHPSGKASIKQGIRCSVGAVLVQCWCSSGAVLVQLCFYDSALCFFFTQQ